MNVATQEDLQAALAKLQEVIGARVRAEQLRCQLTNLPNLHALNEMLRESVQRDVPRWVAFNER